MARFVGKLMKDRKLFFIVLITVAVAGILGGLFINERAGIVASLTDSESTIIANPGFTYIPVTESAAIYQPGLDSGACITEVFRDSPAEKAGLRPGDVIMKYNGIRITDETPLLGVMRTCNRGSTIEIEVRRGEENRAVDILCPRR